MGRSSAKTASSVKVSKERKDTLTQLLDLDSRVLVKTSVHEYLYELLQFTAELIMNNEVIELVGGRYQRNTGRDCGRWGSQPGSGFLLGQRVPLEKPRVRTNGAGSSEVGLSTYEALNSPELLNEAA